MSDEAARTAWMGTRALGRKEARIAARSSLRMVAGAGAVLVVMRLVSSWVESMSPMREVLPLLCVLVASMLGGESVAGESAERTAAFLAARPMSPHRVRAVKLAVHGAAAMLASVALSVLVHLLVGRAELAWLETLDVPATSLAGWPLALAVAGFTLAFAASTLCSDGMIAGLAGSCLAIGWIALALAMATRWTGSLEATLRMGWLTLALVTGPAVMAVVAVMAPRRGDEPSRRAPVLAGLVLAAAVVPWVPLAVMRPARDLVEIAHRTDDVGRAAEIADPSGHGVAFVATSRAGTRHAVILHDGEPGEPPIVRVLPADTRPVEWSPRGSLVLVEWPWGHLRVVPIEGSTRAPRAYEWSSLLHARECRP